MTCPRRAAPRITSTGKLLKVPPSHSRSPSASTGGSAPGMAALASMPAFSGPWVITCSRPFE
jgi:hypothetical protein